MFIAFVKVVLLLVYCILAAAFVTVYISKTTEKHDDIATLKSFTFNFVLIYILSIFLFLFN